MVLVALTGGIASGKSVVAKRLTERGAVHIDADLVAREVVEPGQPALARLVAEFGQSILTSDGRLDRSALGRIAFADSESVARLNAITHPAIWQRVTQLIREADAANPSAIVVYDVPLLVEAAGDRPMHFDRVIVVEAEPEVRLERMITLRGMSREDAEQRLRAQASNAERRAVADDIIDTNGSIDDTLRQVDDVWERISRS
jgi:dephospho-CoA kinase